MSETKKVNESVWSELRSRANGESTKGEDFVKYVKETLLPPEELSANELAKLMKEGVVHFQYRKKPKKGQPEGSGEIRDAWGTKKMEIVSKIPHGGDCPPKNVGYTIYFDLEKEDWRAFRDERLIGTCPKTITLEEFNLNSDYFLEK